MKARASAEEVYGYLTRLGRLLQAEERSSGAGLLPVQLHALHYLNRCNRLSDRPAVVAEYLGVTKGTASQTLRTLEERGLVKKHRDPDDGRVTHLRVTSAGKQVLEASLPPTLLKAACEALPQAHLGEAIQVLEELLRSLQRSHGGRSFGVCRTCIHFQHEDDGRFRCGLTQEPLSVDDSSRLCREHEGREGVGGG